MNKEKLIKKVKKISILKVSFYFFDVFNRQFNHNPIKFIFSIQWFIRDYLLFKKNNTNTTAQLYIKNLLPQLADKTSDNPMDHIYVLQNAWACKKIFDNKPNSHVDIGSSVSAVAIMSQFVPTTVVDIRGIDLILNNMNYKKGSILSLPFKDNSIESLSSMCVVEHIGLGRYGDKIDQFGTEKSLIEIQRVVAKNGHIILSVPVNFRNTVLFNAHREFVPSYFINLMKQCKLVEYKYIVGNKISDSFTSEDDNVVGLFEFIKK
jgi:hypothetical protein